eukprot:XP_003728374.1 PREDICTED: matrix metalloproteinase-9 [Strongylocentrotus purpuratus]
MGVRKLCVIILLFFLNTCTPFPASRLHRGARSINDWMGKDSTTTGSSTVAMNSREETFEANEDDRLQVQEYLERNGYLPVAQVFGPRYRISDDNFRNALQSFQRFVHLPDTGVLDEETFRLTVSKRCGVPDLVGPAQPSGLYTSWAQWHKLDLTYRIVSHLETIAEGALRATVRSAMEIWMEVTPLSLCEELDPEADVDIIIRHERGEHGDGVAFDGLDGALGHAFLPATGEIHLDLDEQWTVGRVPENNGTDYMSVVSHQIGHALGLLHSGVEGSIMFPIYTDKENINLSYQDVLSIQSLYGNADDSADVQHRCRDRTTTSKTLTSASVS